MDYVVPAAPQPSVAVVGTPARFPVRRIYCVGRNYLAHVREFGNDEKAPPFFFAKANSMIVEDGATIQYPPLTGNYHHEVELVAAIGKAGAINAGLLAIAILANHDDALRGKLSEYRKTQADSAAKAALP